MYYTYVLRSKISGKIYTGYTRDLRKRFKEHKNREVFSTKSFKNIELIYYEACMNKEDVKSREKYLKSGMGKRYIKNRLRRFLSLTGFTLIELLLAVTLFSIIAVALYSSLATGIKIHEKGMVLGSDYGDMQIVLDRISRDLRMAISINEVYLKGESQTLDFFSCQPYLAGGTNLYKITYSWKREGNYYSLYRLKETYIDGLQERHAAGEDILDGIKSIKFSYGYFKKSIGDTEEFVWKDDWKEEKMPRMVKLELETKYDKFVKVIDCPRGEVGEMKEE